MTRLPVFTVCFTLNSVVFLASAGQLAAAPPEAPGQTQTSETETPARSGFSEVIQAGARLFGRKPHGETAGRLHAEVKAEGTSSAAARKAAIAALPLEELSPESRQKVNSLLKSVSFFRRLPKVSFAVEPEVYNYFMAHPDAAVSIWRAMKISKLQMWQTGRYDYEADTGDGSVGALEVLHAGSEKNLVACDGLYKSPLLVKPIEAKSLLFLQTNFTRDADGTAYVTHRADLFVAFPSQTVDVVSRIFSPLTVSMTDRTFTEVSLFLKMMSLAMTRRPDWVEQIAGQMEGVADIRRDQVLELNAQVHSAARKRALEQIVGKEIDQSATHEPPRSAGLARTPQ